MRKERGQFLPHLRYRLEVEVSLPELDEGIRRFVGDMPKYTSYRKMNCMLGFVVKEIDVGKNVDRINQLLQNDYTDIHVEGYLHTGSILDTYISSHGRDDPITLIHMFPNCASLMVEYDQKNLEDVDVLPIDKSGGGLWHYLEILA